MGNRLEKIHLHMCVTAVAVVLVAVAVCHYGLAGGCGQSGDVQVVASGSAEAEDAGVGHVVAEDRCAVMILAPLTTGSVMGMRKTKRGFRHSEYVGNLPVVPGIVWSRRRWPVLVPGTCDSGLCRWVARGRTGECARMREWPQYVRDVDALGVEESGSETGLGGW